MTTLEVRGLTVTYSGSSPTLRGLDLSLRDGERFVLLGTSGSGKSTLLRAIAGLEQPVKGDVLLGSQSVLGLPAERRGIGLVFQQPLLFPHLSVEANLRFGLDLRHIPRREAKARIEQMLSDTGLEGLGQRYPHQLSGGQEQRVALARALITEPRLLLLDEPFSALDAPLRREMRRWVVEVQQAAGTTMLLVTHDQEEALAIGERIGLLEDGQLLQVDEPEGLFLRPATLSVARFFGAQNFFPGRQSGPWVNCELGRLRAARQHDGAVTLVIRPESLALAGHSDEGQNRLNGVVTSAGFAGSHRQYEVLIGTESVVWHAPLSTKAKLGDTICLECPPEACWTIPST